MDEYKNDLAIRFDSLDTDWRDQSILYMKWSERWANAIAERDRAQEAYEIKKALVDRDIREEYTRANRKTTENEVAALLKADASLIEMRNLIIDLTEEANILQAAKASFESRKKALEGLTNLWISGYFSAPSLPKEFSDQVSANTEAQLASTKRDALEKNERLQQKRKKLIAKEKTS